MNNNELIQENFNESLEVNNPYIPGLNSLESDEIAKHSGSYSVPPLNDFNQSTSLSNDRSLIEIDQPITDNNTISSSNDLLIGKASSEPILDVADDFLLNPDLNTVETSTSGLTNTSAEINDNEDENETEFSVENEDGGLSFEFEGALNQLGTFLGQIFSKPAGSLLGGGLGGNLLGGILDDINIDFGGLGSLVGMGIGGPIGSIIGGPVGNVAGNLVNGFLNNLLGGSSDPSQTLNFLTKLAGATNSELEVEINGNQAEVSFESGEGNENESESQKISGQNSQNDLSGGTGDDLLSEKKNDLEVETHGEKENQKELDNQAILGDEQKNDLEVETHGEKENQKEM